MEFLFNHCYFNTQLFSHLKKLLSFQSFLLSVRLFNLFLLLSVPMMHCISSYSGTNNYS